MPGKKEGIMDAAARKLRIGGLEKPDGSYVATSDLSAADRKKIETLGRTRNALRMLDRQGMDKVGEAITGRKSKDVQKQINDIYAGKTQAYKKGGPVKKPAVGRLVMKKKGK
jgi:hypothetical protein